MDKTTTTSPVLSAEDALKLKSVVMYELEPIFRQHHLNRDIIIGFVGDRGDGKSVGTGVVTLLDYMVENDPCWSNMDIQASINVDPASAALYAEYGVPESGGTVNYKSLPLDLVKLLQFHPRYRNGCIAVEEINIALADARRSMSSQNLESADFVQMLRKTGNALIYNTIDEMFIDPRIREATDIFIRTEDTALTPDGLAMKKRQGYEFKWVIYAMSRKLTGERYKDTRQTLGPVFLHGRQFWGLVETDKRQDRNMWTGGTRNIGAAGIQIESDGRTVEIRQRWEWLYLKLMELRNKGVEEIQDTTLWDFLQLNDRGISTMAIGRQLKLMGVKNAFGGHGHRNYIIDNFRIDGSNILDKTEVFIKNND